MISLGPPGLAIPQRVWFREPDLLVSQKFRIGLDLVLAITPVERYPM